MSIAIIDVEDSMVYTNEEIIKIENKAYNQGRADERAKVLAEIKEIIATKTNPMYWIEKMVKEQKNEGKKRKV